MRSSLLGLLLLIGGTAPAAADCTLAWHSTIPMLMQGHLPTVPVEINGSVIGMLVDTGAGTTTVTPKAAREIGLRPIKDYSRDARVSGVAGGAFYEIDAVQTLRLGGVTYRNIPVFQSEMDISHTGEPVSGILGIDLLSHYDLALDEPAETLGLYTAPTNCGRVPPPLPGAWHPVAITANDQGELEIQVALNGRPTRAVLDTGAAGTLIEREAANRAGLGKDGQVVRLRGIGEQAVNATRQTLPTLSVGEITLHDVPVLVTDRILEMPPGTEMLLGSSLLNHVPALISYRSRTLWLGDPAPVAAAQKH